MQHEGGGIPPTTGGALSFTQAIVVTTRDANHLRIIAEVSTRLGERRSQWCEVDGKKINACGKGVRVWGFPTPGFKQPAGRSIHVEPPWREHAHMAPFADGAAGFGPGFKDARAQTAFNEVSGGGESDRTAMTVGSMTRSAMGVRSRVLTCASAFVSGVVTQVIAMEAIMSLRSLFSAM